uniref:Anoctamin n=1 Tax=Sinocyclocheilus anshuiensis TaxID=1608454 RepID=A0A671PV22_9TELE
MMRMMTPYMLIVSGPQAHLFIVILSLFVLASDFVLVWEVMVRRNRSERRKAQLAQWRDKFIQNLQSAGLLMEKKTVHYLKLHAPWDVLVYYAEELRLRAPLQVQPHPDYNTSARVLQKLWVPNIMKDSVPNRPVDYYTCAFRKSKMEKFLGSDDRENYFTNTQRHRIVYEILARTVYGRRKRAEVGVARLLNEGAFTGAFPLHEGPFELPGCDIQPDQLNKRQVLYHYWSNWLKWYKYQPLDHIREYFGEKIALYFAWLGFYTAWLLPAALVGTCVFVSVFPVLSINILPACSCLFSTLLKVGYLFDHPGTVFFSVFMSLWAVTFLEYWKRKNATLAHHWDCMDFHEEEEPPRPEFAAMAPAMEENPVTGVKEPYFPEKARISRMLTGSMVIVIMVRPTGVVRGLMELQNFNWPVRREIILVFCAIIFQIKAFSARSLLFYCRFVGYPGHYGTLFGMRNEDCGPGGCLIELAEQLCIIMVGKQLINNVQEFVIPKIKSWRQKRALSSVKKAQKAEEPKRWEQDYELIPCEGLFDEYLEIVLQFGFITIFVAAFPLAPLFALLNNWVEVRLDACKFVCEYRRPVAERAQHIGVWFIILEALSHVSVIVNAFLIAFTSDFLPRLLYQYKFNNDLHGYVNFTLAYSPPSYNYSSHTVCRYKAFRDENGKYTLVYWELLAARLGFIIAFEHVVFFVLRVIDWMVPDIPESLELKIKRERYLAKQALADKQEALLVSSFT